MISTRYVTQYVCTSCTMLTSDCERNGLRASSDVAPTLAPAAQPDSTPTTTQPSKRQRLNVAGSMVPSTLCADSMDKSRRAPERLNFRTQRNTVVKKVQALSEKYGAKIWLAIETPPGFETDLDRAQARTTPGGKVIYASRSCIFPSLLKIYRGT